MTRYAVQCYLPYYDETVVLVEAGSREGACKAALEKACREGDWNRIDDPGEPFVVEIAENPDEHDLWQAVYDTPGASVPAQYSQSGPPICVTIIVESGCVQDVIVTGGAAEIIIDDRDNLT